MKRLDDCLNDCDLIREDIAELNLDAAIEKVEALLRELVRINGGGAVVKTYSNAELFDRHGF